MTMIDEHTDLDIEVIVADVPSHPCYYDKCEAEGEWMAMWSCGHAYTYCDPHMTRLEQLAAAGQMACGPNNPKATRLIRKERV
jgi:hypothetical protein